MRICEICNNPVFGTDKKTRIGYCKSHQYLRTDLDKRSILQKAMEKAKKEPKRKAGRFDVERIEINERDGTLADVIETDRVIKNNGKNGEQWRWFEKQRSKMKGVCDNCGGKTQKHDDNTFYYSIAHLLPKSHFKSIATNDENWLELCYYGNSCHSNFDNHMIDITELNCFDKVIEKIVKLYPHISKEERRRIPAILLEYIKTEL